MIKVGCIAVVPVEGGFVGMECDKNRGLILPGGKWERDKDKSYHHAAARELLEETGLSTDPEKLEYIWHGPDTGEYITFAFLAREVQGTIRESPEGMPRLVTWDDLLASHFGAYYRVLREVMARWSHPAIIARWSAGQYRLQNRYQDGGWEELHEFFNNEADAVKQAIEHACHPIHYGMVRVIGPDGGVVVEYGAGEGNKIKAGPEHRDRLMARLQRSK
jgi:ADP-ribose pyrophosphatase YjhB (NUDIX family)